MRLWRFAFWPWKSNNSLDLVRRGISAYRQPRGFSDLFLHRAVGVVCVHLNSWSESRRTVVYIFPTQGLKGPRRNEAGRNLNQSSSSWSWRKGRKGCLWGESCLLYRLPVLTDWSPTSPIVTSPPNSTTFPTSISFVCQLDLSDLASKWRSSIYILKELFLFSSFFL